jgi:hypothetical protein
MINTSNAYGYALRDCKLGKTYEGTLYEVGELCQGYLCRYDTLVFKDDKGDEVVKFVRPEDMEYEEIYGRPIKFRILRIYNRDIYGVSLRDCSEGTVYKGTLYDTGEIDIEGDITERPTIFFKDDVGDNVVKYVDHNFTYVEVV